MKVADCSSCFHKSVLCDRINMLPYYQDLKISKTVVRLPTSCFEETLLGNPKGALRQFRGPGGAHVLEYEKYWVLHRDRIDPRHDPVGHLVTDAPEFVLLGLLASLGVLALVIGLGGETDERR